jgi:hypothetical protein
MYTFAQLKLGPKSRPSLGMSMAGSVATTFGTGAHRGSDHGARHGHGRDLTVCERGHAGLAAAATAGTVTAHADAGASVLSSVAVFAGQLAAFLGVYPASIASRWPGSSGAMWPRA